MKKKCPDCKETFEIDLDDYDEGDYVNCPECNLELVVIVENGKLRLKIAKEKEFEEEDYTESFEE